NIYTSGLHRQAIVDVAAAVGHVQNYLLTAIVVRPYESEDLHTHGKLVGPQLRFVYQLRDPTNPERPFEQLYLHLNFSVVKPSDDELSMDRKTSQFLKRFETISVASKGATSMKMRAMDSFIRDYTKNG